MIKLKTHFNHLGLMYGPGDIVSDLPNEIEQSLIKNKAAEQFTPKDNIKAPEQSPPKNAKKETKTRARK